MNWNQLAKLSKKNIVVTGSSGYIGPHLCNRLEKLDCNVYALGRNVSSCLNSNKLNYESIDLTNMDKVVNLLNRIKPQYIFHLAGHATGDRSIELIHPTFHSNLVTTLNILTAATEHKLVKIIITGSMEEPVCEDYDLIPSSPYAVSKWAATNYARMFNKLYLSPIVIIRLFMVYGPGKQNLNKLVPHVINNLLVNNSPQLSSGNRLVDWIYIDDVVDGLLHASVTEGIEGQTVDIGSGNLISIYDFVMKIHSLMNSDAKLLFGSKSERPLEQIRKADLQRTVSQIKWLPQIDLNQGLKYTINEFISHFKEYNAC